MNSRFGFTFALAMLAHIVAMTAGGSFGMFAIVVIPVTATLLSLLSVALCVLVGLVLRLGPLQRLWQRSRRPAAVLLTVGLVLFLLGLLLRHPAEAYPLDTDPDEQHNVFWPSTFPGLLLFLFAVLHWPASRTVAPIRVA